ncbi:hypothetical protein Taro_020065 [Colocasia esculenta]|uniref:Uncharacterized protein n=1 Tax=Colocasia esculenta TaxID=4460 RepID=A0A843V197_COLES|nr:hypothetical protein [Colocasia esculenta]
MASPRAATEAAQPQPPPSPKSPPTYPDVCERHRLQVGLQTLNREIGFLKQSTSAFDFSSGSQQPNLAFDFSSRISQGSRLLNPRTGDLRESE